MTDEKPHARPNALGDSTSPAEREKALEHTWSPQSIAQLGIYGAKDSPGAITPPDYGHGDSTPGQGGLGKHLRDMIKDLRDHDLPPMSSASSVIWKGLTVRGAGPGVAYQRTVKDTLQAPVTAIQNLSRRGKPPERTILRGVEGVLRDGQMLLVLGRPGSGCSSLLKSLCGLTDEYLGWEGDVRYNGVDIETFKKRFRGDAAYSAEVDTQFPHVSVGNTLDFVSETKLPRSRPEGQTARDFVKSTTDLWATNLGLRHTLQTRVGDDFVRGVSGGERKRVSLGEILATRASVSCWDNPTRGLDASTSLDFIRILRELTTVTESTTLVALYQAGENLVREFDKVTIMYLGRQIFFGPMADAKAFFEGLGFICPPRQTTADFLTAVTDPHARTIREGWEDRAPRTPEEFVGAWKRSPYYMMLQKEMKQYEQDFAQSKAQFDEYNRYQLSQKARYQREKSIYMVNLPMQMVANVKRAFYRLFGDRAFLTTTTIASILLSFIMGGLYYDLPHTTSGFFSRGGVVFFATLIQAIQALSEIGTQYAQRPIVQRQKTLAMYHPFVDSISTMIAQYPYKLLNVTALDIILYFMTNLKRQAGAFFIFWITTLLTAFAMSAYFRTVAAATRRPEPAMAVGGISVLIFMSYSGYMIPRPTMRPWFKWLTYINPLSYTFETLLANEFHNRKAPCTSLIPSGPGYEHVPPSLQVCAVTGSKPGQSFVSGDDYIEASFGYHYSHVGRNIAILCVFVIGFTALFSLATEFNSLATNQGEQLAFRKGREPDAIRKALQSGTVIGDVESNQDPEPTTEIEPQVSEPRGLVKSNDIFTWEQLNYDIVTSAGETRRLLNDVSGYVKPGTLTALMGESGAGKTTLLNVLAQRADTGVIGGQMSVNNAHIGRSFQRRTGYVQQQDVHLAESTVREALRFSAVLRQPADVPLKEKYDYVENVIQILEMQDYAEAVIGSPGNGLNMEQRKRTTIAVELVAKPALLLFLDEPTSGLDSQSAWSIVRFLRKLANSGQAILCTIHQPSSVLFEQFDRLLLLKKGGETVYFGDIGQQSRTVIDYFESNGAPPCPSEANPAEYILDVIGAGATAHADRDYHEVWMQSKQHVEAHRELQELKNKCSDEGPADQTHAGLETEFAVSWFTQYRTVQHRIFLHYWRSPTYVMGKFILNINAGLFIGFTFYKENVSVQGLQNKVFAMFLALILGIPIMNQLQPCFHNLTQIYVVREKPSKLYHFTTITLSVFFAEITYNMVAGSVFFLAWFNCGYYYHDWPSSADKGVRGFYMWLMFMFFEMWISTFGLAVGAMAPEPATASALTFLFVNFTLLFCGVLQPVSQLISFWHWLYRASPATYIMGSFISNALHGLPVTCAPREINHFSPPRNQTCGEYAGAFASITGNLLNPGATDDCQFCRYKSSDEYLAFLNIDYNDRWRNIGLLGAYVLFNLLLLFTLFYLTKVAPRNFRRLGRLKSRTAKA